MARPVAISAGVDEEEGEEEEAAAAAAGEQGGEVKVEELPFWPIDLVTLEFLYKGKVWNSWDISDFLRTILRIKRTWRHLVEADVTIEYETEFFHIAKHRSVANVRGKPANAQKYVDYLGHYILKGTGFWKHKCKRS